MDKKLIDSKGHLKELGASMMEAVMLVALISIVAIGSARVVGQRTQIKFTAVETALINAAGSSTGGP